MSDKVQKIKEEFEKRIESINSCPFRNAELGSEKFNEGELYAYKQILAFIDSLPEEHKKQPKYKVGDIIKGPKNNIFEIKEVLENQYVLHSKNGDELNSINIVDKSSSLVEEHNKDLEEEFYRFIDEEEGIPKMCNTRECIAWSMDIARHFAERQKQKTLQDFLDKANEFFHEYFYLHPHDCCVVQYVLDTPLDDIDDFVEQFKKYMKDESEN